MELFEAIKNRHSYRGSFTDQAVRREDLTRIVESAIAAPSACNAQSPTFVVIDDPALLKKMSEIITTPTMQTAKAMIICIADKRPVYNNESFWKEDCAAAVENMLLAITGLGYASVWYDGVLRNGSAEKIAALLNVPKNLQVQILLPIGVPAESKSQPQKHSFGKRAWFNKYGE
ncbi:MAG: nitroreductase family protein [Thermoguttaceae bacterium]